MFSLLLNDEGQYSIIYKDTDKRLYKIFLYNFTAEMTTASYVLEALNSSGNEASTSSERG